MPDLAITFNNGVDASSDELRAKEGFVRKVRGMYFDNRDADRLHALPGRTLAGTAPSTTSVRDLAFLQFDGPSYHQLLVWANSKIYEAQAGTSGLSFSAAQDQQSTPADFSQSGSSPKAIHDGQNRWVCWSGADNERPLVRDYDGTWRYLSLKPPAAAPTLTAINSAGTITRPDGYTAISGYARLNYQSNAYDADDTTSANRLLVLSGQAGEDYTFSKAGAVGASHTLYVKLGSEPSDGSPDAEATMIVKLSEDGGTSWITIFSQAVPVATTTASVQLTDSSGNSPRTSAAVNWSDLRVRCEFVYDSGTAGVTGHFYEIWASDAGGTAYVAAGTYNYVVTEVVSVKTLPNQSEATIESAPSPVGSIDISASTSYGITLTLPDRANLATDGVAASKIIRRIYRSTASGVYPDLGLIGTADISDTEFTDNFDTDGATLGSPTINVADIGGVTIPIAGQCPAFQDATLHKGSIVAIPYSDPYSIQWSYPGRPDYWPLPAHDLTLLPSDHGDKLIGVLALNDAIVLFLRNRVLRIRDLPIAGDATFNLQNSTVEVLSHNIGLAGGPRSYCTFSAPSGRELCAFVASNGLWITDATLPSDRGMGLAEFAPLFNWEEEVDTTALATSRLTYDPISQLVWFDYDNQDGDRKAISFAVAPKHWIEVPGHQVPVPKFTGPHDIRLAGRAIGEISGTWHHWGLEASTAKVFNERTGTKDNALWFDSQGDMERFVESFWYYPFGAWDGAKLYLAGILHSDWGPGQTCQFTCQARTDDNGVVVTRRKDGVSLHGSRVTRTWLSCGGQSFRFSWRHIGQVDGVLGPFTLEAERVPQAGRV